MSFVPGLLQDNVTISEAKDRVVATGVALLFVFLVPFSDILRSTMDRRQRCCCSSRNNPKNRRLWEDSSKPRDLCIGLGLQVTISRLRHAILLPSLLLWNTQCSFGVVYCHCSRRPSCLLVYQDRDQGKVCWSLVLFLYYIFIVLWILLSLIFSYIWLQQAGFWNDCSIWIDI